MNVVVTGGGTIAPIDDVRYLTNTSTGSLSAAITEACLDRGATVWHIHAPKAVLPFRRSAACDLDAPFDSEVERLARLRRRWSAARDRLHLVGLATGNVADYQETLRRTLAEQPIDVAFLAMAVADFEPEPFGGKISSGIRKLQIYGRPTPKVIRSVREWAPHVYLVGFKLLSGATTAELIETARRACRTNQADLTVANDQSTVRSGRHTIHLVRPEGPVESFGPEDDIAARLVDRALHWAAERA